MSFQLQHVSLFSMFHLCFSEILSKFEIQTVIKNIVYNDLNLLFKPLLEHLIKNFFKIVYTESKNTS